MAEPRGRLTCHPPFRLSHLSDLIRSLPALPQPVTQPAFLFLYLLSVLVLCTSALFYFPYSLPYSLSLSFLLSSQLHPSLFLLYRLVALLSLPYSISIYSLFHPPLSLSFSLSCSLFSLLKRYPRLHGNLPSHGLTQSILHAINHCISEQRTAVLQMDINCSTHSK